MTLKQLDKFEDLLTDYAIEHDDSILADLARIIRRDVTETIGRIKSEWILNKKNASTTDNTNY